MSNAIIATPDDTATLSGTSAVSGFPLTNLQNFHAFRKYKVSGSSANIIADFGSASDRRLIFLGYTNLTDSSTYQIRAATSEADLTTSPGFDTGSVSFDTQGYDVPHLIHWTSSAQSYRWWRIDVSTVTDFEAARLYIVDPFQTSKQVQQGISLTFHDDTKIIRSRNSHSFPRSRPVRNGMDINFSYQSQADMIEELNKIKRQRGRSKDVFVSINPDHSRVQDVSMYGLMTDLPPTNNQFLDLYESRFKLIEEPR